MDLIDYIERLHASMDSFMDGREVSRELKTMPELEDAPYQELAAGRFTILSTGLGETRNIPGNAVSGGTWSITVIGQIKLNEDCTGAEIEDAEFAMFADLEAWLNSPIDDEINCIEAVRMTQSQQLEKPYGWIAVNLEVTL